MPTDTPALGTFVRRPRAPAPQIDRIGGGFARFIAHAITLAGGQLNEDAAAHLTELGIALDQELEDLRRVSAERRAALMARPVPDLAAIRASGETL